MDDYDVNMSMSFGLVVQHHIIRPILLYDHNTMILKVQEKVVSAKKQNNQRLKARMAAHFAIHSLASISSSASKIPPSFPSASSLTLQSQHHAAICSSLIPCLSKALPKGSSAATLRNQFNFSPRPSRGDADA
jgi:hypothetical protein